MNFGCSATNSSVDYALAGSMPLWTHEYEECCKKYTRELGMVVMEGICNFDNFYIRLNDFCSNSPIRFAPSPDVNLA